MRRARAFGRSRCRARGMTPSLSASNAGAVDVVVEREGGRRPGRRPRPWTGETHRPSNPFPFSALFLSSRPSGPLAGDGRVLLDGRSPTGRRVLQSMRGGSSAFCGRAPGHRAASGAGGALRVRSRARADQHARSCRDRRVDDDRRNPGRADRSCVRPGDPLPVGRAGRASPRSHRRGVRVDPGPGAPHHLLQG